MQIILDYASLFPDLNRDAVLLFGSLKTRGLVLARSSASFSFCTLSGRDHTNSLDEKQIVIHRLIFFFFLSF